MGWRCEAVRGREGARAGVQPGRPRRCESRVRSIPLWEREAPRARGARRQPLKSKHERTRMRARSTLMTGAGIGRYGSMHLCICSLHRGDARVVFVHADTPSKAYVLQHGCFTPLGRQC